MDVHILPPPRESKQPSYPPREAHPSYATVGNSGPNRHGSTSGSASPLSTPSSLHHVAGLPRSVSPQNGDGKTQLLHPHSSAGPRRRDSSHSHPASEDAPGSDLAREPAADEDEPASESDRPAKRSRRENEHAREDVGRGGDSVRHRPSPARDEMTA
ncbi:homeobox domain protein [Ceratobasidium sp. AG-Ba]|nr:homeobox domain protein [Ceratobasidium sp. AG-Ba]